MNFFFYTNIAFEDWDYDNSVKQGIGGSETSIVEMSWRLAAQGHTVTVYAPIKKTTKSPWRNVVWKRYEKATFKQPGIWILYRCPEILDKFKHKKDQTVWLLWQDWDYLSLTAKRSKLADHHITLCKAHGNYILRRYPYIDKKQIWLTSNGLKSDLVESIKPPERNPLKIIYTSSPDRGLKQALLVFRKAKEYVPDLELHAFYGFNNYNKMAKKVKWMQKKREEIEELMKQKGVFWHGRISQQQLYKEWLSSGIWLYITNFFETSCISCMEAQAMGAIPIFSPIYAQKENVRHGIGVEGDSNHPLTIARAAAEVVRLATDTGLQEQIRVPMMLDARTRYDWEIFVSQWIFEAEGKRKDFEKQYDFPRQL